MRIRLITVSHRVPKWLDEGYSEYAKRLPRFCRLELVQIEAEKRTTQSNLAKLREIETNKILRAIKPGHYVMALVLDGEQFETEQLAKKISEWSDQSINVDLLVGGPEGLSNQCILRADFKWSLSKLTFPHTLVRVILAEQIYRACTILQNHPYHK